MVGAHSRRGTQPPDHLDREQRRRVVVAIGERSYSAAGSLLLARSLTVIPGSACSARSLIGELRMGHRLAFRHRSTSVFSTITLSLLVVVPPPQVVGSPGEPVAPFFVVHEPREHVEEVTSDMLGAG